MEEENTKEKMSEENSCREELLRILDQCLQDAKMLAIKHRMNTEENQVRLAVALLRERMRKETYLS